MIFVLEIKRFYGRELSEKNHKLKVRATLINIITKY